MALWIQILIALAAWGTLLLTIVLMAIKSRNHIMSRIGRIDTRLAVLETISPHEKRCKVVAVQGIRRMRRALSLHVEEERIWRDNTETQLKDLKNVLVKQTT